MSMSVVDLYQSVIRLTEIVGRSHDHIVGLNTRIEQLEKKVAKLTKTVVGDSDGS